MILRTHTRRIVWHHSLTDSGDVASFRRWHVSMNHYEDIGYHAVILRDGTLEWGRDIRMIGAHAKGKNHDSLGVCLVGDFRYYEPSKAQLDSVVRFVHDVSHMVGWDNPLLQEFHHNGCPGKMLDRVDFVEIAMRGYL